MKKTITILPLLATLTIAQGQNLIQGTTNQVIWGKVGTKDTTLKLNYLATVKPISMTIGYNNPNGVKYRVYFKGLNVAVDLFNIVKFESGVNEWGDLLDGFYVQVATHDFDGDKNPEIIIAVGNGLIDMSVNIIKYHPPTNPQDAIRMENWTVIANFQAQEKIHIDKQVITAPFGSQGLYDEYTWVNGKFVKTN